MSATPRCTCTSVAQPSCPFADGAFDLVTQFTCLSSILEPDVRSTVADEMRRVTRASGACSYDMRGLACGSGGGRLDHADCRHRRGRAQTAVRRAGALRRTALAFELPQLTGRHTRPPPRSAYCRGAEVTYWGYGASQRPVHLVPGASHRRQRRAGSGTLCDRRPVESRVAVQRPLDRVRQPFDVARLCQLAVRSDRLGHAPDARRHDRKAAAQRLEHDDRPRLHQARQDEEVGAPERLADPVPPGRSGKADAVVDAERLREALQLRTGRAIADELERELRPTDDGSGEGAEQHIKTLELDLKTDVDEARRRPGTPCGRRMEDGRVDGVRDDAEAGTDAVGLDGALEVLADGADERRPGERDPGPAEGPGRHRALRPFARVLRDDDRPAEQPAGKHCSPAHPVHVCVEHVDRRALAREAPRDAEDGGQIRKRPAARAVRESKYPQWPVLLLGERGEAADVAARPLVDDDHHPVTELGGGARVIPDIGAEQWLPRGWIPRRQHEHRARLGSGDAQWLATASDTRQSRSTAPR